MIRKAVWAGPGKFYPADELRLKEYLKNYIVYNKQKLDVKMIIIPHAGYIYSGPVAGKTVSAVNIPDSVIILGPNHTGLGGPYSAMASGVWKTPLGEVSVDETLTELIIKNSEFVRDDISPHLSEHSIEVEIPFLQYINENIKIVPIVIADYLVSHFKTVGEELADAIMHYKKSVLIVASSDMTHYESHEQAKKKDYMAIEEILKLNPEGLIEKVHEHKISMCGFAPVAVALFASKKLGAKKAQLIEYQTSGQTSGDYSSVVGYAGIIAQ